jgi:hypothetical protein
MMTCQLDDGGRWRWNAAACETPLVLAFDDAPIVFTKAPISTSFAPTEWVSARTPWLALDDDGSGCVESADELFGPTADGPNGFAKLARLDENGDGRVDARDPAWARLLLWSDANQDRVCTVSEIRTLADAGVVSLATAYTAPKTIPFGSYEGERGTFSFGADRRGRIVDVYLAPLD